jgi:hypothetical protein
MYAACVYAVVCVFGMYISACVMYLFGMYVLCMIMFCVRADLSVEIAISPPKKGRLSETNEPLANTAVPGTSTILALSLARALSLSLSRSLARALSLSLSRSLALSLSLCDVSASM